jgi:hypothetical protein
MSNQGSSDQVSLQADVGNIPNNTVAVLGALSPFIQAVSADNVSPLAVVQVEALGACFHLNGELAGKIPDLLRRTTSYRLERLSHYNIRHVNGATTKNRPRDGVTKLMGTHTPAIQ